MLGQVKRVWFAEGAAVATALGGQGRRRRRRVLSDTIEMLVTGEEGLSLEMSTG